MKILHIIPGSGGGFYCGNCLRDSKYVPALKELGHEVVKIPMYLPLFSHDTDNNGIPVFYGAVSIYLKQVYPIFRNAPLWIDKLLNTGPVLKLAAQFAGSTNATGLEEMTVSMLLGEDGQQKEELERMVDWIKKHYQPDIIHLSNALLLGLAHRIKERLNTTLICSLQDEDVWVDVMEPVYRKQVWKLMQESVQYVDGFIAVSDFYAGRMKEQMQIPDDKLRTVHIGVDPADYSAKLPGEKRRAIGYISRLCHDNGLDILVDAFIELKKRQGFSDVQLIITGGSTGDDTQYIKDIKNKLSKSKNSNDVIFHDSFIDEGKKEFFDKVSVISVPVRNGEAFGIYLLEAMASGVPVIQPALGAFPEIINIAKGGLVYEPNQPLSLADRLAAVLADPKGLDALSRAGIAGVSTSFNIHKQALEMIDAYNCFLT
jgi:glycosyltransferase involved in cell wall biosynthesis